MNGFGFGGGWRTARLAGAVGLVLLPGCASHARATLEEKAPAGYPGFTLRSLAVGPDGVLPVKYTGDGDSVTPPLEWTGAPKATRSFALIMHHVDPEGRVKWYWTLWNIPAGTKALAADSRGVGTAGNNSVNGKAGYAPPHSKGPGKKVYTLTLYALSKPLAIAKPAAQVSREVLLAAMKDCTLGAAQLKVNYTRSGEQPDGGDQPGPPPPPDEQGGGPGGGQGGSPTR